MRLRFAISLCVRGQLVQDLGFVVGHSGPEIVSLLDLGLALDVELCGSIVSDVRLNGDLSGRTRGCR